MQLTIGCDPELFLTRADGSVIASEKVIPLAGLQSGWSKLVRDGIQVELNPGATETTPSLGKNISALMRELARELVNHKGVKPVFAQLVNITKEEMDSLPPESRMLGCKPSHNFWDKEAVVGVNGDEYLMRSGSGHPHFGLKAPIFDEARGIDHRERVIPLMDACLGNTLVLIDRDPGNIERRKHYGRAGEWRPQPHGLEYRTPSNFWLRAYPLMDLVFCLGKLALWVLEETLEERADVEGYLCERVNFQKVRQAINENDKDLAAETWKGVSRVIHDLHPPHTVGLSPYLISKFDKFVATVQEKGIEHYFPKDPMQSWITDEQQSFNMFLQTKV